MEAVKKEDSLKKINQLIREIKIINGLLKELNIPEKILEKQIKLFGNASHVILPKKYANKKAKIIIKR